MGVDSEVILVLFSKCWAYLVLEVGWDKRFLAMIYTSFNVLKTWEYYELILVWKALQILSIDLNIVLKKAYLFAELHFYDKKE